MMSNPSISPGHVGLTVSDLDRSQRFYQEVLGLSAAPVSGPDEEQGVFLSADGVLLVTLWEQGAGAFDSARPGLHHLAFQVPSRAAVEACLARVEQSGSRVFFGGVSSHREGGPSGGIWFEDPDGIRLEVFAASGFEEAPAPTGAAPTCGFF